MSVFASVALLVGPGQAFWSSTSSANGTGVSQATTVGAGGKPNVSVSGSSLSLTWSASTLASGAAVGGYSISRYDASTNSFDALNGCSGTVTATSCTETGVPDGAWRYTVTPVVGANWQGAESSLSASVLVDTTAPSSSLSLSVISGAAQLSGTTVYYNGNAAGSFKMSNAVSDAGSGPASSKTATLTGTTTGWSHSASTVTTPSGGPYVSNAFSWTAGTTSSPTETVTTADVRGNTSTTTLNFVNDNTAPTGTISYADGYQTGRSVSVSFTTSGGATSAQLQRARASLKNGSCGSYGSFANVGPVNPTSPYVDGPFAAGACYKYQLIASDSLNNSAAITSTNVVKIGYAGAVLASAGLISYWRLGENAATVSDAFTGTARVALQDRTGETGATWTRHASAATDAVLTASGRLRKEGTATLALYYSSGLPTSADYRVSADVYTASVLTSDRIGVTGRMDTSANTYYVAAYDRATNAYTLSSVVTGTTTSLGTYAATISAGETHRITLDMAGTTIRVLVDGAQVISTTSSAITAAGRGGVVLGGATSATDSDTYGMQLDNYVVGPVAAVPAAVDSKGGNTGAYVNGPVLGQAGALTGDSDTAASFDGVDDYVQIASPTGLPTGSGARTAEVWFKTTSAARQVLFAYGTPSANQEFGLWLNAGGTGLTSWGGGASSNDRTWSLGSAVTNGAWHQAVLTYTGSALVLYVDGTLISSQAATRSTTIDSYGFGIGAVLAPGVSGVSGGYFAGALDEVAIYSGALDATTIADHYALANPYQDVDGPTGGYVDGTGLVGPEGRYLNTTSLTLSLAKGTDATGVAATGATLTYARVTLGTSTNTCNAFATTYSALATDPVSNYSLTVSSGYCYRFRYTVADTLGNSTTYTSPSIKIDTSAPTLAVPAASALANTYLSGSTLFYRSTATSGSVTFTGKGTDTQSSIASYAWPALGTGWSLSTASTQLVTNATATYSWSTAGPAGPGTQSYATTNYAALTSTGYNVVFTDDTAGPTGGAISYPDGKTTATPVSLTFTTATDGGSGVNATKSVQYATAPAAGGTCGTFGAYVQYTTTTGTSVNSPALLNDTCYKFQYVATDNVGNTTAFTSSAVVRKTAVYSTTITATSGILSFWRLGEASGATSAADSKSTNTGTYAGTPALGVTGAIVADTNTAATFDGSTQYVSMSRGLTGTNLSLELWLKSTQTNGGTSASWSGNAALADADVAGAANDFGVSMTSDGRITAGTGAAGGVDTTVTSAAGLNDGQWHYVVFTRSSAGALVLYVDGVQVATATGGTATLSASATMTLARAASGARFYAGTLDEVATYNAVLSAVTVTAHYNAGK